MVWIVPVSQGWTGGRIQRIEKAGTMLFEGVGGTGLLKRWSGEYWNFPPAWQGTGMRGSRWKRGMTCGDRRRVADGTRVFTTLSASNSSF